MENVDKGGKGGMSGWERVVVGPGGEDVAEGIVSCPLDFLVRRGR